MVSNYQHHLYPRQSEFVKYRGKTGQIDIKDSIVSILAKKPGLTFEDIAGLIFHHSLRKSWYQSVPRALDALMLDTTIIKEESSGQYYLANDALSHDIGKTQQIMDRLLSKGLKPEQVTFLSSAIIMAGEEARAEHEGVNYHTSDTVASSPVIVPPAPVVEEKIEEEKLTQTIFTSETTEQLAREFEGENDVMVIDNPFEKLSAEEQAQLKDDAIVQIRLAEEAAETERLKAIAEKEEADRLAKEEAEALTKAAAYKNKLSSIRSATDLLGLDVEVNLPDLTGQVVGTILEIKPDGVLFLIVFSKDSKYPEGSIQNIFYKDNLSYKILA